MSIKGGGMTDEQYKEFLSRGGRIRTLRPAEPLFLNKPTTHYHFTEPILSQNTIENAFRFSSCVKNRAKSAKATRYESHVNKVGNLSGKHVRARGQKKYD